MCIRDRHYGAGADYLGIGPFRFTTTKKNLSPVLGLKGYSSILSQMKEANIEIPVVAIGGITYEDIPAILHTGVDVYKRQGLPSSCRKAQKSFIPFTNSSIFSLRLRFSGDVS